MSEKVSLRRWKVTESRVEIWVKGDSGKGNSVSKGPEAVYLVSWKSSKKTSQREFGTSEGG